MNGLAESYGEQVDFRAYNIASDEGQAWANQYSLRGHPAYVLLDEQGNERWRGVGVIPGGVIEREIRAVVPVPQPP